MLGSSLSLTPVPCTLSVRWVTPNARSVSSGVVRGSLRVAAAPSRGVWGCALVCWGEGPCGFPPPLPREARKGAQRTLVGSAPPALGRCGAPGRGGDSLSLGSRFPSLLHRALLAFTWVSGSLLCSALCSLVAAGFLCPSAFRPLVGLCPSGSANPA